MEHRLRAAGIQTVEKLCPAPRGYLRAAWGSIEGERYWLKLRGFDLPALPVRRGSIGHSHVLGPELRTYEGMRAVMFKLLAKAAMRLRHERFLAGGLSIRIRFVGLEARFERDQPFALLDDSPTLLRLLGEQLGSLEQSIAQGRWNLQRHPPLSVAVTLVGLETGGSTTEELMDERRQGKRVCNVLDRINQRCGNNALYFGCIQDALSHDAAPMRIPFSKIPEPDSKKTSPCAGGRPSITAMTNSGCKRNGNSKCWPKPRIVNRSGGKAGNERIRSQALAAGCHRS